MRLPSDASRCNLATDGRRRPGESPRIAPSVEVRGGNSYRTVALAVDVPRNRPARVATVRPDVQQPNAPAVRPTGAPPLSRGTQPCSDSRAAPAGQPLSPP